MDNFCIYKEGRYDRMANLKLKLDRVIQAYQDRAIVRLDEIDYYFTHHEKITR